MAKGNHRSSGRSFRPATEQAKHVAKKVAAHCTARHGADKNDGLVRSIGAERTLKSDLAGAAEWLAAREPGTSLATMTRDQATQFLQHRAEAVRQSALDSARQSLDKMFGQAAKAAGQEYQKLDRVISDLPPIDRNKSYTSEQIAAIALRQQPHNVLATQVVRATGIRAHELITLRSAGGPGGQVADYRNWAPERFAGLQPGGERWLVDGKGGLTREVYLPRQLADQVRAGLGEPRTVTDRGVRYTTLHREGSLGMGAAWSASFGRCSKAELGWSEGGHALRHEYVKERMETLTKELGMQYEEARLTVSSELGHLRPDILRWYGFP